MHADAFNLADLGRRLRDERSRLGVNQDEFAALGAVNRNSQGAYESGRRCPDASYLAGVATAGVDVAYVVLGRRSVEQLEPDEAELLACRAAIGTDGRGALLTVAATMAGRATPRHLHARALDYQAAPAALPPEGALARMFEGLLQLVDREQAPAALAHELATLLPTALAQLTDLDPSSPGLLGTGRAPPADGRASRQAPRT